MLFISIHKIEGLYWKHGREILRQKTEKMQLFITHLMLSEELISTDQSMKMYFKFSVLSNFKENISGKITFYRAKICLLLKTFFLNSVTFQVNGHYTFF